MFNFNPRYYSLQRGIDTFGQKPVFFDWTHQQESHEMRVPVAHFQHTIAEHPLGNIALSQKLHAHFLETAKPISVRLYDAMQKAGPVRLTKRRDLPLDAILCRAVAGQQLSAAAASTIWGRVLDAANSQSIISFIEKAKDEHIRACGLSRAKTKTMKSIATASAEGLLDEAKLQCLAPEARCESLTAIWGVGQWTADMINIFYFGEKDIWPAGDVAVWKTLERLTSKRRNPTKTAGRFAPKRSYLALYMYKIVNEKI